MITEVKYCADCQYSKVWASGWSCYSPHRPRDIVTGEFISVKCRESRADPRQCGTSGVFFLKKEQPSAN